MMHARVAKDETEPVCVTVTLSVYHGGHTKVIDNDVPVFARALRDQDPRTRRRHKARHHDRNHRASTP